MADMISTGAWDVHVVQGRYGAIWFWTATSDTRSRDEGHGSTNTRRGAIRAAKRFCNNPNPPEKQNRYDFTFQVLTEKK